MSVVMAVFLAAPIAGPIVGEALVGLGGWRAAMAGPGSPGRVRTDLVVPVRRDVAAGAASPAPPAPDRTRDSRDLQVACGDGRLHIDAHDPVRCVLLVPGSSQPVIDNVYGRSEQFALFFGSTVR